MYKLNSCNGSRFNIFASFLFFYDVIFLLVSLPYMNQTNEFTNVQVNREDIWAIRQEDFLPTCHLKRSGKIEGFFI